MSVNSAALLNVAVLDALGRFVGNIGVPAAIALLVLYQITPRLDAIAQSTAQLQTTIQVETIACARQVTPPTSPGTLGP